MNKALWLPTRLGSIALAVFFCVGLQAFAKGSLNTYNQLMMMLIGIYVTLAVSLNLINGITGQFSIGHAAFYQIGAYTAAISANTVFKSFAASSPVLWLGLSGILGAIAAGIAGFLVGLPSLRLKGDYLAVVTLGIGEIVTIIAKNQESLGKAYGLNTIKVESIAVIWLLAILCVAVCRNLLKTAHGLAFLAVREDEIASSSMGVNLTKIKVTAFVIGSAFAGAAGALYAHTKGFVGPADFSMDVSFLILTMVVLGGTGSITGTTIAAMALFYIPEKMRDLPDVSLSVPIAVALGLIAAVFGLKRIQDTFHGKSAARIAMNIGCILAGVLVAFVFAKILGNVPQLQSMVKGSNLRMPVLAVTLVVLMLLRPQGIFGHHEFSWSWVQRLFGKKAPQTEVAV
jgi:branched-chain amino acid transport system permease protein